VDGPRLQGKEQREPGLSPWPRKQKIVRLATCAKQPFCKC
jgi:hypothetical protein